MKVIVASDSFKGSATSLEINESISRGIKKAVHDANIIQIPIADGGEGTCDALLSAFGGKKVSVQVHDPLMRKITAHYGVIHGQIVIIEMAQAAGITLLKQEEQNPSVTTTYGVGELIRDAIDRGYRQFIIGIGGSATNDAGMGMLEALGYRFYDQNHHPLPGIGASLSQIARIEDSNVLPDIKECSFQVMCDVNNPFYGENGASFVYAPQKGADPTMVKSLDDGLKNFAKLVFQYLHIDLQQIEGSGAAGGLGGTLHAFLNASLVPGIQLLLESINVEEIVKDADLIITGEGKIDRQSAMGKVISGFGRIGQRYNIPVIALCGTYTKEASILYQAGITAIFSNLMEPVSLERAMDPIETQERIERLTENVLRLWIRRNA